ncbi:MAG: polysaccharide deacetylase family protein [Pseudomonadales bacterium]|nr:polysaccharide deacetylase family protein [Pseudomonadales bacterium]
MRTPALCLLCLLCLLTPTQGRTGELIILQYHFVSDAGPDSTSVSPERFEAHLRIIEEEGLAVVALPSALDTLSEQDALPERAVAITFDDGYVSVYRHAFPRLAERSWPFTVFVNPEAIDNGSQAHADWAALREMQHAGATIANHGMRHAFLVRRDPALPAESDDNYAERIGAEITVAERRINAELGASHRLFAYAYGEYDSRLRQWLEARGYRAFGQHSGVASRYADPLALPRFPVSGPYSQTESVREKLRMGALPVLDPQALPSPTLATKDPRPELTLPLASADLVASSIACYASDQGRIDSVIEDAGDGRLLLTARPPQALPLGRSRYNCTGQGRDGRWRWFSQPWLRLGPGGEAPP